VFILINFICVRDVHIYIVCGVYLFQDNCNSLFGEEQNFISFSFDGLTGI